MVDPRGRVSLWGPVVGLMLIIFGLSSKAALPQPAGWINDKVAHALTYGLLGALWYRALAGGLWSGLTGRRGLLASLAAIAYGVTDELHQSFVPGRTMEAADLRADALGAVTATIVLWACGIILRLRVPPPPTRICHGLPESPPAQGRADRAGHGQPAGGP